MADVSLGSRSSDPASQKEPKRPRVLAVEVETEGHHPGYVQNFTKVWLKEGIEADLDFLVTPTFFEKHQDVVEFVQAQDSQGIRIHSITKEEEARMERISYLRYFHGWKLYCKYAKALHAGHGLFMYSDFFQLPLLLGTPSPCPFSMIYFRPTFHYSEFRNYRASFRETLKGLRKKLLLGRVLKNSQLSILYCLDEVVVDYIKEKMDPPCHVQRLADTFTHYDKSPELQHEIRARLGIESERRVMMLLGVLDRRKGVIELLECLRLIPEDAARKLCILLVGRVHASHRQEVLSLVEQIPKETNVQVVLHNHFIDDDEIQHHFAMADVTLTTYQKHIGSSAALIRAAFAEKPVLSSDYGLMGELVSRRKLGRTVDTTDPSAMAKAIEEMVTANLLATFNPETSADFARENLPAQLGRDLRKMLDYASVAAES